MPSMLKLHFNASAENTRRNLLREERRLAAGSERVKKLTPTEHRRRIELQQRKDPRWKILEEDYL